MSNIDISSIIRLVNAIHRGKSDDSKKLHKYILLISLIQEYESSRERKNSFLPTQQLEDIFRENWIKFVPSIPFSSGLLEIQFYYLQGDNIWKLVIKDGYDQLFSSYNRITKNRILECVQYAEFLPPVSE